MEISGRVQNGVVVLDGPPLLPEGAAVRVSYRQAPVIRVAPHQTRIEFPLVPSPNPGSLPLTNDMIAAIQDEEDAASGY